MVKVIFDGEEYEVVDTMRKTQHNTPSHVPYQRPSFGSELTTGLILACISAAIAFGAFMVLLIKWLG